MRRRPIEPTAGKPEEMRPMQGPGEILLISCYELGHQPMGIAGPAGFLQRAGFTPDAVDLSVQSFDPEQVRRARIAAFSVPMHTALRLGVQAARRIREIHPECTIVFFGLYAALNAGYLLEGVADAVIGGEVEGPLLSFVQRRAAGWDGPIEGVICRGGNPRPYLAHLPFVPPSRSSLPPLEKYAHLEAKGSRRQVGYVETSRGCRHLCRHCPIPPVYDGRFFLVPQETVLEDIRSLVEMGAAHISFGDPDFLNGPNHSLRIVRRMHETYPNLTFDFTAKVEHLLRYRVHLPEMAALGCLFVISAVESLNDVVLSRLEKGHTRADALELFRLFREVGITLRPSLVPFTPWETLEDMVDLFNVAEQEGLIDQIDPVQYSIRLLIPPGSLLIEEPEMAPHLGPLDQEAFSYRWRHPDSRMDLLQKSFSQTVEAAAAGDEDPERTFYRLKELVRAMREGRPSREIVHTPRVDRPRPPRLTEAWFCCAEPTEGQFAALDEAEKTD